MKSMEERLTMDVSEDQYKFLQREAQKLGITMSNYVRRALGLPDVNRGRRSDLMTEGPKRVRLRAVEVKPEVKSDASEASEEGK